MSLKNKIRRFMEKKNLNPMNNRKKVGIILFATSIGLFFLFAVRFSYIVIGGHVAGTSLAEKTKQLYQGSEVVKAKRERFMIVTVWRSQKMPPLIQLKRYSQKHIPLGIKNCMLKKRILIK